MQKNKRHYEKPKRRFRREDYEKLIEELYSTMKTAEIGKILGLTQKQIENGVYRMKTKGKPCKDKSYLSKIRSECGKKGGRPRKEVIK